MKKLSACFQTGLNWIMAPVIGLLLLGCSITGYAQNCSVNITTAVTPSGDISICYRSHSFMPGLTFTCSSNELQYQMTGLIGGDAAGWITDQCATVPCCTEPIVMTWTDPDSGTCSHTIKMSCCTGLDTDGDGICDEDDCHPQDGSQTYGPGAACDDGNPNTWGDHYDDNCNCVGYPGEGCLTGPDTDGDGVCDEDDCHPQDAMLRHTPGDACNDGNPNTVNDRYDDNCNCLGDPDEGCLTGNDSDGDGVCDEDDCNPQDPNQVHSPGDYCNDGNPATYNDQYDDNCNCIGEPLPCGDVDPDDGCPLTTDGLDGDCNIINTPPDPDDGCPLTYDYFDAVNCVIVNVVPDVDDGCELTTDYFDIINCVIVNEAPEVDDGCDYTVDRFDRTRCRFVFESLPCDDGNPETVGDEYDADCECIGYDPCELKIIEWEKVLTLLRGR